LKAPRRQGLVVTGGLVTWAVSMVFAAWSCTAGQARSVTESLAPLAPLVAPGAPGAVLEDSLNIMTWRLQELERRHLVLEEKTGEAQRLGWQDWLTILGVSSGGGAATGGALGGRKTREKSS